VLNQTFRDWEYIIIGDCTPDHSENVVKSFEDQRIRFYNLAEKSPPGSHGAIAKNYGIQQMARADIIAYLDDDDCYHSRFLEIMIPYMQHHANAMLAYCRSAYRDKRTGRRIFGNPFQRWLHGYSREKLRRYNFLNTNCVVHRKTVLEEVGYWNPDYYFDDYELWLRISETYDFHHINKVLVDTYVEEPPFCKRAWYKGLQILRHGRSTPVE
jgi:glycosyltransferase involved in cell wall biosynthesis